MGALHRSRPSPPVHIVHLGLGGFHRAHQAYYTHLAGEGWGIAAFTNSSAHVPLTLTQQDGVYTVISRGPEADRAEVVESLVEAHRGTDVERWRDLLDNAETTLLTLTVTEAGYRATADGVDWDDDDVTLDLMLLRDGALGAATMPGRVVSGLAARRAADAGPLTVVSADNLPGNGEVARRVVVDFADRLDAGLAEWIDVNVAFVSTVVDRITPASTDDDVEAARRLGWDDAVPVVAEPYLDWVLADTFRTARPNWEAAGARFVPDLEPYHRRKLWLLNAGHSLLAYRGLARGLSTVAEAFADDECRVELEALWVEASESLAGDGGPEPDLGTLRSRFSNPRIRHPLRQIATDGHAKLPVRVGDVVRARLAAGLDAGDAELGVLAAWARHLADAPPDPRLPAVARGIGDLAPAQAAHAVLTVVLPELADDTDVAAQLTELVAVAGNREARRNRLDG